MRSEAKVHAMEMAIFDDIVDVPFFQQVAGVLVIGAEHAALHILITQQRRQRLQIAAGGLMNSIQKG